MGMLMKKRYVGLEHLLSLKYILYFYSTFYIRIILISKYLVRDNYDHFSF